MKNEEIELSATLICLTGSGRANIKVACSPRDSWNDWQKHLDKLHPGWIMISAVVIME